MMELIRLAHVDSTSAHAAALLAQGKPAPFAVQAERQSAGRGRRGHTWESPSGNLYLTLVMPAPSESLERHGLLPLRAGVVVARLLAAEAGVRVTLKWPNDLLFAGRKLGGLLLETSLSGGQAGEVLIGLGLNLNVTPEVAAPYKAIALADVVGEAQDVAAWSELMTQAFAREWAALDDDQVLDGYAKYAIESGQLWRRADDGALFRSRGLAADGGLELEPLPDSAAKATPLCLATVEPGLQWIHLEGEDAPLLVADVGNSRIKIAAFGSARACVVDAHSSVSASVSPEAPTEIVALEAQADETLLTEALAELRARLVMPRGTPLHVLSVNPLGAQRLSSAAKAAGFHGVAVPKRPLLRQGRGYALADLGADRLAAIEGALLEFRGRPAQQVALILVAGTATTLDVVAADGRHLGGLIFPGLGTALKSLHDAAALLPDLDPGDGDPGLGLGHDTVSAMRQGVLRMTIGAVRHVQQEFADRPQALYLTGGHAAHLALALGVAPTPDLVLNGIRAMVLGGYRTNA